MVPYCAYGSLLSLWIPIVLMVPYCPYGSLLSSLLSLWFPNVLDPFCPGSLLSWIHLVLDPFCPGSFLSCLVRSERAALTRKYRARTWAMEWHWQRTTFPANGPKNEKKLSEKKMRNIKNWRFRVEVGPIEKRIGSSSMKFHFRCLERINIPKYSIFDRFWRNPFFFNIFFSYIRGPPKRTLWYPILSF